LTLGLRYAVPTFAAAAVLSAAPFADQKPTVTIIGQVTAGTTVISGIADKSATIEVKDLGTGFLLALQGGTGSGTADSAGAFTLTLAKPLYCGQKIQFLAGTPGSLAPAAIGGDSTKTELDISAFVTIIGNVGAGATEISGITGRCATVGIKDLGTGSLLALNGGAGTVAPDNTGAFTLTLAKPLNNQKLQFLVGTPDSLVAAAIGGDSTKMELDIPALTAITITGKPTEGTTVISGSTEKSASIEVKDLGSNSLLALTGGTADKSTGAFTLTLSEPLYGGQRIQFLVATSGSPAPAAIGVNGAMEMEIKALGDWGRVRANFAAGTVLSFDNNFQLYNTASSSSSTSSNSSQATLFFDFLMEKNWSWAGVTAVTAQDADAKNTKGKADKGVSGASGSKLEFKLNGRVMLTSFFETRLTSLPVSVCPTITSTTSSTNPTATFVRAAATGTTGSTSNSSGCGSGSSGTDTLSSFLNSAKSAELQAGVYIPILLSVWSHNNAPNAMFVAPVAHVGFIAPTASTTSGSTSVQPLNSANFYNFFNFGGRFGHFKLTKDKNAAPELLSYLDVAVGRYSNLETLQFSSTTGTSSVRRWRVAIEGTLKLPSTPFLVGVSANIGQNLTGPATIKAAKDDLRFFIGARFDIGKLLAKLPAL
jgi:hypothetical protein